MKRKNISVNQIMPYIQHINAWKKIVGNSDVHFHNSFEIVIVVSGYGTQKLNGVEYEFKRGCVTMLTPNDFHSIKALDSLEVINIMFNENLIPEEIIDQLISGKNNICYYLGEKDIEKVVKLCDVLINENNGEFLHKQAITTDLLKCLILMIIRNFDNLKFTNSDSSDDAINYAMRYLYIHFTENPSVKALSELCGYTPNYFCNVFYKRTGKRYTEFLNILKINLSKKLLVTTKKASTEIAFSCGFSSLTNYYRVFNKIVGISPSEYRKKHIKKDDE